MNQVNTGKAAIFDIDGTLLDSMHVWHDVDARFLARRGIAMPSDYARAISSMSFQEVAQYTIERFKLPDSQDALIQEWNDLALDAYTHHVQPKAHALSYLHHLRATGARIALATSLLPSLRMPALHATGIAPLVDAVVGVEEVNHVGKNEPDVYVEAARRVQIAPELCTVFEDLTVGVQSAQQVHMQAWGVFDDASQEMWSHMQRIADGTITDFNQAPRVL